MGRKTCVPYHKSPAQPSHWHNKKKTKYKEEAQIILGEHKTGNAF